MTKDFELLVSLDKVHVVSKDKDASIKNDKLLPGYIVALDANGNIVKATKGKAPAFVVISDENEPVTLAAGKIALMFGISRFKTKHFVQDTYAVGDPLTVETNGYRLTKAGTGEVPLAYVEAIDTANGMLVVRWVV